MYEVVCVEVVIYDFTRCEVEQTAQETNML
jgi:hypothetical protein